MEAERVGWAARLEAAEIQREAAERAATEEAEAVAEATRRELQVQLDALRGAIHPLRVVGGGTTAARAGRRQEVVSLCVG